MSRQTKQLHDFIGISKHNNLSVYTVTICVEQRVNQTRLSVLCSQLSQISPLYPPDPK